MQTHRARYSAHAQKTAKASASVTVIGEFQVKSTRSMFRSVGRSHGEDVIGARNTLLFRSIAVVILMDSAQIGADAARRIPKED